MNKTVFLIIIIAIVAIIFISIALSYRKGIVKVDTEQVQKQLDNTQDKIQNKLKETTDKLKEITK